MTDTQHHQVDLVIAGGGMAGVTLALALSQCTDLNIAIVEAHQYEENSPHPGFDARSLALAAHSCDVLKGIGLSDIEHLGNPIRHIHVSDQGHLGQCRLHAKDYQLGSLGTVVELHVLGKRLHQLLNQVATNRVSWYCPDRVTQLEQDTDHIDLLLSSGTRLRATLLVVAEGGQSATRKMLKIQDSSTPYPQVALIANVLTSKPHENWAFERFTDSGPLALLPLPDEHCEVGKSQRGNRCSLVWTIPPERQSALMAMPEPEFLTELQQAFGYRLGRFVKVGERHGYPLSLITASQHICHRAAVMGNASQSLHPIAGQGFNIGLRDVETLSALIGQAAASGKDIGDFSLLNCYQKNRQADQRNVVAMTDGLVRAFSNQHLPLVVGRNLGLSIMNVSSLMKSLLANQAMGFNARIEGIEHAIL